MVGGNGESSTWTRNGIEYTRSKSFPFLFSHCLVRRITYPPGNNSWFGTNFKEISVVSKLPFVFGSREKAVTQDCISIGWFHRTEIFVLGDTDCSPELGEKETTFGVSSLTNIANQSFEEPIFAWQ
ncbi:hypothetical protein CH381_04510 [Leptospira sp. mixed culture ATI2-C-A1]|nr:hypothetical protein CH381_04510 [Leptospira sp. mixed culture ATI2-C-A1]